MKQLPHIARKEWLQVLAIAAVAFLCCDVRASGSAPDLDGDGIPNIVDPDVDNDGIPNALDRNIDGGIAKSGPYEGQYIGDHIENENPAEDDMDADGLADDSLAEKDIDGDGKDDDSDLEDDIDGDGRKDDSAFENDLDGDGKEDDSDMEDDIDGDGLDDDDSLEHDIDGDGKLDGTDDDIDGDGKLNGDATEHDTDGDGLLNDDSNDKDDDGDGVEDLKDDDDNNDGTLDIDDASHQVESGEDELDLYLTKLPAAPADSTMHLTYTHLGTGSAKLSLSLRDVVIGSYNFLVAGVVRGTIQVVADGGGGRHTRGDLVFRTGTLNSGELLLDFAVSSQIVLIQQTAVDYFSSTMPAANISTDTGGVGAGTVRLTAASGVSILAKAKATLEFEVGRIAKLQIEMEQLPAGDYSVLIGDALRGTIHLGTTTDGAQGELVFNLAPTGSMLLLNFPTSGQSISITQGATTLFFGQLPTVPTPAP